MISNISVLNTIQDNALDFYVDAAGFLNVTGCPRVKASSPVVKTIVGAAAVAGVSTFAFTPVANYTYSFRVTGYDSGNNRIAIPFYYTTPASGADATSIATAVRAMIASSIIGAQFASIAGTTTVVLTATAANPLISFENFNKDPNMTATAASVTTTGVEAIGLGSDLLVAYSGFAGSSAIVPTALYNQYEVTVTPPIMFGGQSITEVGSTTYLVLINQTQAATVASGNVNTSAFNLSLLIGNDDLGVAKTLGTITGLANSCRVIVSPSTTTTTTITATAGAPALGILTVNNTTSVTASIAGNIMSVTAVGTGGIFAGQVITGSGVTAGTKVLAQLSGTASGIGTYSVSAIQTVASTTVTVVTNLTDLSARQGDAIIASLTDATFGSLAKTTLVGFTSATAAIGDNVTAASTRPFKLISCRNIPS